ncbi:MAG: NADH-quinone oxidoreductase subunit C [Spirochaetia bacterium]|nr:NADH-quinone oxidoreductase subunit C [Spirochaetia bacterium]
MRGLRPEQNAELMENIKKKFSNDILHMEENRGMVVIQAKKENFLTLMKSLKDDKPFMFDTLMDLTAVDYSGVKDIRFEVIYMLFSSKTLSRIRLKLSIAEKENAPSVINIWKGANWPEREVFDLMGIRFDGHPLMERLIMPDGYIGHPLRKDFPIKGLGEDYLIESILMPVKNEVNLKKEGSK